MNAKYFKRNLPITNGENKLRWTIDIDWSKGSGKKLEQRGKGGNI